MDFDWFFNSHRRQGNRGGYGPSDDEDDFFKENGQNGFNHPFGDPFASFGTSPFDIFHHMEDMMNQAFSMHSDELQNGFFNRDMLEAPQQNSPRSAMIKDDKEEKFLLPFDGKKNVPFKDNDMDNEVAKYGEDKVLDLLEQNRNYTEKPKFSFRSSFSSIRRVQLPNQSVEEHRTSRDSQGNESTTVRRWLGDQMHEVTTHSDEKGMQERVENFQNLDENELDSFEKKWHGRFNHKNHSEVPAIRMEENHPLQSPPGDPSYSSLFKKFFGF